MTTKSKKGRSRYNTGKRNGFSLPPSAGSTIVNPRTKVRIHSEQKKFGKERPDIILPVLNVLSMGLTSVGLTFDPVEAQEWKNKTTQGQIINTGLVPFRSRHD